MVYRVEKAFGCFTLEGFGKFNAWLSIIVYALEALHTVLSLFFSDESTIKLLLMIVMYIVALYFSKQFLDGVKQRDHKKMQFYVYVNIALAGLATLGILFVTVIILFDLRTLQTDKTVDRTALAEIFLLVLALFVGFQFYCLVCINSLFLRIKEENLNTLPSGRASNNNAVFMNQQKPAMPNQQGGFDQPPPYPAEQTSQFAMQK